MYIPLTLGSWKFCRSGRFAIAAGEAAGGKGEDVRDEKMLRFKWKRYIRLVVLLLLFASRSVWAAQDASAPNVPDAGYLRRIQAFFAPGSAKETVEALLLLADVRVNGTRPWDITVHNDQFYSRVLSQGSLGLGESYVDGWWDCQALDQCIERILRAELNKKVSPSLALIMLQVKAFLFNLQDILGSQKVIDAHYQIGNDLFEAMLDPTMTYSCGYWKASRSLQSAQEAKYDLICQKLRLQPGMRILDIGCGWGGFVKFAAKKYGVQAVGVTLSENQADYARRISEGLPVEIRIQDWRDIQGSFDRIISIGMFEHVGVKNYRPFMELARRSLAPDGLFLLHTIGSNRSTRITDPWIHTYIFPNGQLPSIAQIGESIEGVFVMEDWHNFGPDYTKTLLAWQKNFEKSWPQFQAQYGERFRRLWNYYLLSCAGSFRARTIQLWQIVLSPQGVPGGYSSVR